MKVPILPSILSANFAALGEDCKKTMDCGVKEFHFDVMDGHFVPNLTIGAPVLSSLKKYLPNAVYDVHLMVTHPLNYIEAFAKAGANWITFHCESESDPIKTIDAIRKSGVLVGVSIKPSTPPQAILPLLDKVDLVLIMSVEPGFGGQEFLPSALEKITFLRKEASSRELHSLRIEVDGGINAKTAALCVKAGANALVAGSSIFSAPSYEQAINELKEAANQALNS